MNLAFLGAVVVFSHHPVVFLALFMFFLGFSEAYKRYRGRLILREGLMVGFFLAGLVVLGGQQKWWLQPLLTDMEPARPVHRRDAAHRRDRQRRADLSRLAGRRRVDDLKYSLVAGAVTGGGLTVIANAPNPAGFAILKGSFEEAPSIRSASSPLPLPRRSLPLPLSSSSPVTRRKP